MCQLYLGRVRRLITDSHEVYDGGGSVGVGFELLEDGGSGGVGDGDEAADFVAFEAEGHGTGDAGQHGYVVQFADDDCDFDPVGDVAGVGVYDGEAAEGVGVFGGQFVV